MKNVEELRSLTFPWIDYKHNQNLNLTQIHSLSLSFLRLFLFYISPSFFHPPLLFTKAHSYTDTHSIHRTEHTLGQTPFCRTAVSASVSPLLDALIKSLSSLVTAALTAKLIEKERSEKFKMKRFPSTFWMDILWHFHWGNLKQSAGMWTERRREFASACLFFAFLSLFSALSHNAPSLDHYPQDKMEIIFEHFNGDTIALPFAI